MEDGLKANSPTGSLCSPDLRVRRNPSSKPTLSRHASIGVLQLSKYLPVPLDGDKPRIQASSAFCRAEPIAEVMVNQIQADAILIRYELHHPQVTLNAREVTPNTTPLLLHADVYNYALLEGRRITSTSRSTRDNAGSSLIQARFGTETCTGEVRAILSHPQPGVPSSEHKLLVMVAWMKESGFSPLSGGDDGFVWRKLDFDLAQSWGSTPGNTRNTKIPKRLAPTRSSYRWRMFNAKYRAELL
ncbi:hypothetical protein B0H13DRAFT_1851363 [Mycena leptocephala]|nr:hypothetical protein B0H13DRAFT_1851363 [Mycena leptocephala]